MDRKWPSNEGVFLACTLPPLPYCHSVAGVSKRSVLSSVWVSAVTYFPQILQAARASDVSLLKGSLKAPFVAIDTKAMTPGATYIFQLVTTSASVSQRSSVASSAASITLTTNQPPRNGYLAVNPGWTCIAKYNTFSTRFCFFLKNACAPS